MKIQSLIVAGAVLVSTLAQATPAERPAELPSTVCYPAIAALQEPTTEANLTPYDPFNTIEDRLYADGVYPEVEPATMAIVTIILKEIAKVVGTKIYEGIFKDGSKKSLTKADFDRIAQIVKEALREDAKRKLNDCIINLQDTHRFLAATWEQDIAIDTFTTSQAVVSNIANFDHIWSRLGMVPSAFLVSSLNMGLAQEFLKRDASKTDTFFEATRGRAYDKISTTIIKHDEKLLNESDPWVKSIGGGGQKCGSENEGYCFSTYSKGWGRQLFYHYERCPRYPKGQEYCDKRFEEYLEKARMAFVVAKFDMHEAVYGKVEEIDCGICVRYREYEENLKRIKALPARQPK